MPLQRSPNAESLLRLARRSRQLLDAARAHARTHACPPTARAPAVTAMAVAIVAAACSSLEPEDPPARARAAVVQDVGAMLAQAESAYAKLEWARAAVLYAELVKRDTANADYWFKLGNSEARAGNSERAVAALTRAARLEPEMSKAWFNLSVVELRRARAGTRSVVAERGGRRCPQRARRCTARTADGSARRVAPGAVERARLRLHARRIIAQRGGWGGARRHRLPHYDALGTHARTPRPRPVGARRRPLDRTLRQRPTPSAWLTPSISFI